MHPPHGHAHTHALLGLRLCRRPAPRSKPGCTAVPRDQPLRLQAPNLLPNVGPRQWPQPRLREGLRSGRHPQSSSTESIVAACVPRGWGHRQGRPAPTAGLNCPWSGSWGPCDQAGGARLLGDGVPSSARTCIQVPCCSLPGPELEQSYRTVCSSKASGQPAEPPLSACHQDPQLASDAPPQPRPPPSQGKHHSTR